MIKLLNLLFLYSSNVLGMDSSDLNDPSFLSSKKNPQNPSSRSSTKASGKSSKTKTVSSDLKTIKKILSGSLSKNDWETLKNFFLKIKNFYVNPPEAELEQYPASKVAPLIQKALLELLNNKIPSLCEEIYALLTHLDIRISTCSQEFKGNVLAHVSHKLEAQTLFDNEYDIKLLLKVFQDDLSFLGDKKIEDATIKFLDNLSAFPEEDQVLIKSNFLKGISDVFSKKINQKNLEDIFFTDYWQNFIHQLSTLPSSERSTYFRLLEKEYFFQNLNKKIWNNSIKKAWEDISQEGADWFDDIFLKNLKIFNLHKYKPEDFIFHLIQEELAKTFLSSEPNLQKIRGVFEFILNQDFCLKDGSWTQTLINGIDEASQKKQYGSFLLFFRLLKTEKIFRARQDILKFLPSLFRKILQRNTEDTIEGLEAISTFITFLKGCPNIILNEHWMDVLNQGLVILCEKGGDEKEEKVARSLTGLIQRAFDANSINFFPKEIALCFSHVAAKDFPRTNDVFLQDILHLLERNPMRILRSIWDPILERAWQDLSDLSTLDVVRILAQKMGLSFKDRPDFKYGEGSYGVEQSVMRINLDYFSDIALRCPRTSTQNLDFGKIPFDVVEGTGILTDDNNKEPTEEGETAFQITEFTGKDKVLEEQWKRLPSEYQFIVKMAIHYLNVEGSPDKISEDFLVFPLRRKEVLKRWEAFFTRFLGAASARDNGAETCEEGVPRFAADGLAAFDPTGIYYVGDAHYEVLLSGLKEDSQRFKTLTQERELLNVTRELFFDFEKIAELRSGKVYTEKDWEKTLSQTFWQVLKDKTGKDSVTLKEKHSDFLKMLWEGFYVGHFKGKLKRKHVEIVRKQSLPLDLYLPRIVEAYEKDWEENLPGRGELEVIKIAFDRNLLNRFGSQTRVNQDWKDKINKSWQQIKQAFNNLHEKNDQKEDINMMKWLNNGANGSEKKTKKELFRTLGNLEEITSGNLMKMERDDNQSLQNAWLFQKIFGKEENPFMRSALLQAITYSSRARGVERCRKFCETLAIELVKDQTVQTSDRKKQLIEFTTHYMRESPEQSSLKLSDQEIETLVSDIFKKYSF